MHNNLAHTLSVWEDVLAKLRRGSVCWQGNPLSERDKLTFTEAIVMCALHLTDISNRHDGIGSEREIIAWAYNVCSMDVSSFGSLLSDCVKALRLVSSPTTYNAFKRALNSDHPEVGKVLAPIRGALEDFLQAPNPRGFYVCYQFISFLTRLNLQDIHVEKEDEYVELESYLHSISYPSSIIMEMNSIMAEWMKDWKFSEETFDPHHGPGATAELTRRATLSEKYRNLGSDDLIDYVFTKYAGVDVQSYFPFPPREWKRESVLVPVPKSMTDKRTISKEPGALMYLQQGIAEDVKSYISSHPELRRHIDFERQDLNAEMAIEASGTGRYATIDLSSASDTVTVNLVKAVFRGTPLYPFLVALRSRTVRLPSGKVLRTEKYAPMGSALCFPIQTLIFSCAVEFAVRRAQRTHLGYYPRWRVYGDDIIVADPLYGDVCLVLEALGFMLNASKSYSSPSRFRESCGGDGFDGVEVTPMRISRCFRAVRGRMNSYHAAEFEGLIDMANRAYAYEFTLLRAWIVRVLLDNSVAPPLFSRDGRRGLYSPMPDNYRAAKSMCPSSLRKKGLDFQCLEIQVAQVANRSRKDDCSIASDDSAWYFETLRLTRFRTGDMFEPSHRVIVLRGPVEPILRRTWVPFPW